MTDTRTLLNVRELARLLGISVSSVWRRTNDGTLPQPIRLGGATRWIHSEVLVSLDSAKAERDRSEVSR